MFAEERVKFFYMNMRQTSLYDDGMHGHIKQQQHSIFESTIVTNLPESILLVLVLM